MSGKCYQVKVSAPGKVILHGEHSVVYGKLAVAASLDLRTTVILQEIKKQHIEVFFTDLKLRKKIDIKDINTILKLPILGEETELLNPDVIIHDSLIDLITKELNVNLDIFDKNQYQSLLGFFYIYLGLMRLSKAPVVPIQVTVKTELSLGAGTGSSASFMVSVAACLINYLKSKVPDLKIGDGDVIKPETTVNTPESFNEHDLKLISKWAFAGEQIIHGTPSGIDNTVCTYGSMVSFRKGRAPIAVKCREDIRGLLVDTRVPKDTKTMVKKVKDLKSKHEKIVDHILSAMETIADDALELFMQLGEVKSEKDIEKCYESLGELSDVNHSLLRTLGVSHPALENAVQILASYNLHGKLTGAGGGGYVVALISPQITEDTLDAICKELNKQGYQSRVTKLGGNGVKVE